MKSKTDTTDEVVMIEVDTSDKQASKALRANKSYRRVLDDATLAAFHSGVRMGHIEGFVAGLNAAPEIDEELEQRDVNVSDYVADKPRHLRLVW